ncbi:glycosyltransferase 87 family protein [Gordonia jinghuaiqii]|uniref:glycosyltransferase 87 family protein n=1 Tax=Gordonia jinghuaiqii TaxID=2758710 RepID=UPI001FD07541|nr:glycosyltransferase 87 family protein [Gordonia jinghuaiqii]
MAAHPAVDPPASTRAAPAVISRRVIGLAAIAAVAAIVWHITAFPITNPFYGLFQNATDIRVYRAGADTVLDARSLYDDPVLWRLHFTYPPFAAVALVPLALVTQTVANIIWWAACFATLVAVVVLGLRSLNYRLDRRLGVFAVLLAIAATALEPVRTTLWLGQINILVMALILTDLVFLKPGSRWRGIGVGVAAGLKLTPLFVVVYLLVTRQWRAAGTALAAFGATVVVGLLVIPSDAWAYWTRHLFDTGRIGRADSPANQTVRGFGSQMLAHLDIRRFAERGPAGWVFDAPSWLWVPAALVVAGLGLWAAVVAHRSSRDLLAATIVGMTMCAVSPFAWGHHWVWCVPLLLITLDVALRRGRSRRTWWYWLVPGGVVTVTFTWWRHWWDGGPYLTSDHAISLGLFMMPRDPDPGPWDHALAVLYAGCYPLLLGVTIVVTLVAFARPRRRDRPATGSCSPGEVAPVA